MKAYGCGEPVIKARLIEDKPGDAGLMVCSGTPISMIAYPLNYYPANNSMTSVVAIMSTFPWEEGTSSLVDTIHVEKS